MRDKERIEEIVDSIDIDTIITDLREYRSDLIDIEDEIGHVRRSLEDQEKLLDSLENSIESTIDSLLNVDSKIGDLAYDVDVDEPYTVKLRPHDWEVVLRSLQAAKIMIDIVGVRVIELEKVNPASLDFVAREVSRQITEGV